MNYNDIVQSYYDWICSIAILDEYDRQNYSLLLNSLWNSEFVYILPMDKNRESDGLNMRYHYGRLHGIDCESIDHIFETRPCSMLEMMVALAIRAEDQIMQDSKAGNRTSYWFMEMLINSYLYSLTNDNFDQRYYDICLDIILNRRYEPNGDGGLFKVDEPKQDMRATDIWFQCMWYLDEFLKKKRYWEELTK